MVGSVYWMNSGELAELFEYSSRASFLKAARNGTLPIRTFRFGGRVFADRREVRAYFERQLREAQSELDESS
jgi:hypothetical protein